MHKFCKKESPVGLTVRLWSFICGKNKYCWFHKNCWKSIFKCLVSLACLTDRSCICLPGEKNRSILGKYFICPQGFFWPNHYKKPVFMFMKKLQRNPSVRGGLKIFIFRPYGFDYLGILTKACRSAMRSKTQWVFYRDLDWWPGPQKVQFREITGYP